MYPVVWNKRIDGDWVTDDGFRLMIQLGANGLGWYLVGPKNVVTLFVGHKVSQALDFAGRQVQHYRAMLRARQRSR
jgi:hypothetical protein